MDHPKRVLDLFCGAGGAAMGLRQAWPDAEIVGVDTAKQSRYPFTFIQGNALIFPLVGFDFIWASPPCKRFTALNNRFKHKFKVQPEEAHQDLIAPIRERLAPLGIPYIIENVVGAPLLNPVILCGTMFALGLGERGHLRRHRLFESSFPITPLQCSHIGKGRSLGVSGHGAKTWEGGGIMLEADAARAILEVPWMTRDGAAQCIPPAYSRYIAEQYNVYQSHMEPEFAATP